MKKIIITEEQIKEIAEMMASRQLPDFVSNAISAKETPLSGDFPAIYGDFLMKAAKKRYEEILGYFNDDITSHSTEEVYNKLSNLITKCKKKESAIKDQLQNICYNKVTEMFNIPDGAVDIVCSISDIPRGARLHIKPDTDESEYEDISAIETENSEIQKRKILNFLMYGCASRLAEKLMSDMLKDIFDVDEELPHLYSKIIKINEYLVFISNVKIEDNDHKQGGTVEVQLTHEGTVPKITATGIILPILVQETIAGILEIISTYGLPDDEGVARKVLNVSDAIENEPWIMRIGPVLWDLVEGAVGFESNEVPYFLKALACVAPAEFLKLFNEVTAGTKAGKKALASLYKRAKYEHDYEGFENDLAARRKENMITDSYFTEEELMEGYVDGEED